MLPELQIQATVESQILNDKGKLINAYAPFQNLVNKDTLIMDNFTSELLHFDSEHPVNLLPQVSYDGAVNLIINDNKNPTKLINSRFSVQNDTEYLIPKHYGFKDSNIYEEENFNVDTRLLATYSKIPTLTFSGLEDGGKLLCGSYTFYFKFQDVDGNESEIVQESGIVLVHIGDSPDSSRMGMQDEITSKLVKFILSNIESGFDYVSVLFSRTSSGNDLVGTTTYHKILYKYPVISGLCTVTINGGESRLDVSKQNFYQSFANINAVKALTINNNVLLLGNTSKQIRDYEELKRISWRIIPSQYILKESTLGSLSGDTYQDTLFGNSRKDNYYNAKNVYDYTGYWPDEIYRFGIIYIFSDNSLSPVFNIQGCDLSKLPLEGIDYFKNFYDEVSDGEYFCREYEPNNSEKIENNASYFFSLKTMTNSKGVIKFKRLQNYKYKTGHLMSMPLGIKFDFSYINLLLITKTDAGENRKAVIGNDWTDILAIFNKHDIIGFFFVRLKRIPTILALGMVIGLTDRWRGALPILSSDGGNHYLALGFLDYDRLLRSKGPMITIKGDSVSPQALLVPDAVLNEATFNSLFTSTDFCLDKIGTLKRSIVMSLMYYYPMDFLSTSDPDLHIRKLTNVPENTQTLTNGTDYFSTIAGNPAEAYKTKDVVNAWKWTLPLNLTTSTTLVRGQWGSFVGMSGNTDLDLLQYGDVVNIKKKEYSDPDTADKLEFMLRFTDNNTFHAIGHRLNVSDLQKDKSVILFRGDCFTTLFTHRILRNFIDPELPTNDQIVDPSCWRINYGVRCTAEILLRPHNNLTADSEGWFIGNPLNTPPWPWKTFLILILTGQLAGALSLLKKTKISEMKANDLSGIGVLEDTLGEEINDILLAQRDRNYAEDDAKLKATLPDWVLKYYPNGMANEIVKSFEVHVSKKDRYKQPLRKKLNPSELESGLAGLKAIFKSDANWEMHGIASINRADVNAVGIGQWITFPIASSGNLSFRDIDFSNATEEAQFRKKRSFYPLLKLDPHNPLLDSHVLNYAARVSIPDKGYEIFPDVSFIKLEYFTRIYNSTKDSASTETNEFKLIFEDSFYDYTKEYGSLTKLVDLGNYVLLVFSHGLGLIQLNLSGTAASFLNSEIVMLSKDIGSFWAESVVSTNKYVYGVDHVAKKIWLVSHSGQLTFISDHTVLKFLNDNLKMSEFIQGEYVGHVNIKSHWNAYKNDIIFTYYNDLPSILLKGNLLRNYSNDEILSYLESLKDIKWEANKSWSLCYNEDLTLFTTFYSWCPVASANIDNIFFSFDRDEVNIIFDNSNQHNFNLIPEDSFTSKPTNSDHVENIKSKLVSIKKYEVDPGFTYKTFYYKIPTSVNDLEICFSGTGDYNAISYYYKIDEDPWIFTIKEGTTAYITIKANSKLLICEPKVFNFTFPIGKSMITIPTSELGLNYYTERDIHPNYAKLWKHGQAGIYDNLGKIKPTNWYGKLHEFNFEFVVNKNSGYLKIFNNLKIISNKVEPALLLFEVVGEGYEWYKYKTVIGWINKHYSENLQLGYEEVLALTYAELLKKYNDFPILFNTSPDYKIKKLPFIIVKEDELPGIPYSTFASTDMQLADIPTNQITNKTSYHTNVTTPILVHDDLLNEYRVRIEQMGSNVKKFGRVKGNMEYLEDLWNLEIRPLRFNWAYIKNGKFVISTKSQETRLRDKYCKIKIRYTGTDLVVILGILTMFDYSFA